MLDVIKKRRSIRDYNDQEISKSDLVTLCEAGLMAPSARNQNSKAFIIIEDKDLLKQLSKISPGARVLEKANTAIAVICPDVKGLLTESMVLEDLGAACENVLLEATNLNIGSCWIGIAPNEERMALGKKILNLNDNEFLFALISLGYPIDDSAFYFKDKIKKELIRFM